MIFNIKFKNTLILSLLVIFALSPFILSEAKINSNLFVYGTFESSTDLNHWMIYYGTMELDATDYFQGESSAIMIPNILPIQEYYYSAISCEQFTIGNVDYFDYSFHIKSDNYKHITITIHLQNSTYGEDIVIYSCATENTWTTITGTVLSFAGINDVYIRGESVDMYSSFTWHLDDFQVNYPSVNEMPTVLIPALLTLLGTKVIMKKKNNSR